MRSMLMLCLVVLPTACGAPQLMSDGGQGGGPAMGGGGGAATAGGAAMGGGAGADAGSLPRIDSIVPATVTAGEQLVVLGEGLAASDVQLIEVDSTQLRRSAIKPGSTDRVTLLDAPAVIGLPAAGKVVTLSITTSMGKAQGTFTLLPGTSTTLQTNTTLTPRGIAPQGPIQPGTVSTLIVDVKIAASRAEIFDVSAAVEGTGFTLVDVVPGAIAVPASSALTPVVTPVSVTVRAGTTGTGQVGLKVRPRTVPRDGSILIPRVALEIGATPALADGVLFGDVQMFGPHGLDTSTFVPTVRVLSDRATTSPLVHFELGVGTPDGGSLSVTNVVAPAGWNPMVSGSTSGLSPGVLSTLNVALRPTVADGGFDVPNGEFSFNVEDAATGKSRAFRGQLQLVH